MLVGMGSPVVRLSDRIVAGDILTASIFGPGGPVDLERLLTGRDGPAFERNWLRVDDQLTAALGQPEPADVTEVRKVAYLRAYELTREPELAAAVSDDFGLIAGALAVGLDDDPWLNGLVASYMAGRFPAGPLKEDLGPLRLLIGG